MASLIKDGNRKIQMHIDQIAAEIHRAILNREQITPFTDRDMSLSSAAAYKVSTKLYELRNWQVNGRKIGFTNRSIWPTYGVDQPMWGSMSKNSISYAKKWNFFD
jgi:2-keto-4-pentenoate hydratase